MCQVYISDTAKTWNTVDNLHASEAIQISSTRSAAATSAATQGIRPGSQVSLIQSGSRLWVLVVIVMVVVGVAIALAMLVVVAGASGSAALAGMVLIVTASTMREALPPS